MMQEIWDIAYEVYCETDEVGLWDYLKAQVQEGNISFDDAQCMFHDVIEQYNL